MNSIAGDPARFQRYQALGDGVVLTDSRFAHESSDGSWLLRTALDNVGWRDQRYFADYEQPGRFVISGLWDQIPQFYSVDTKTAYTTQADGVLVLPPAVRQQIEGGQTNLNAYVPISPQFDLREERKIGTVNVRATPTPRLDLNAGFTTTRHSGELPWGASFGFGNDVEVPLPYDSRTNDFTAGAQWTDGRSLLRVGYDGSWFNNIDETLVWDSPLRATDISGGPSRGRTALWPSNSAQTVSAAALTKLARRTQLSGAVSYGFWNNDEVLLPFTINAALPQLALPRDRADAEAHVFSTNVNLVSRPLNDWRFAARLRRYDYNNEMPQTAIPEFINYDTSITTSATGGPQLFAHDRTTVTADATWSGVPRLALTAGYTLNDHGYDFRIFEDTTENVLRLSADAAGWPWLAFRAQYELGDRNGSGLDEGLLVEIGEQSQLRHFDVANRTRNRVTGQVDVTPNEAWLLSLSAGAGKDDFDDSYFGLQESTFRVVTLGADYQVSGFTAGGSYSYERYAGLQRSRTSSPGPQFDDPLRDWTADSTERVHYFSVYLSPPRIGRALETRFSYDYSHAETEYVYGVVPGGPVPEPEQLPNVFNKLQQLRADARYRLSNRVSANLSYLYEPFRVFDFAFDPSVINSIVQPSSLVLGYVYRPYTAHEVVLGLTYFW